MIFLNIRKTEGDPDSHYLYQLMVPFFLWFLLSPFFPFSRKIYCEYSSVIIIFSAAILLSVLAMTTIARVRSQLFMASAAFFAYLYGSFFWSVSFKPPVLINLLQSFITIIAFLFLFSQIEKINKPNIINIFTVAVVVCGIYCLVNIILQYFNLVDVSHKGSGPEFIDKRLKGYGPLNRNPITTAAYLVSYLYLGLYVIESRALAKNIQRIVWCSLLSIFVFIYLTGSRTAYFSLTAGIIYLYRDRIKYILFFITIFVILNFERIMARGMSFRGELWQQGMAASYGRFFFGHGFSSKPDIVVNGHYFGDPHNGIIHIFYFGGIFGVALFFWLIYLVGRAIYQSRPSLEKTFVMLMAINPVFFLMTGSYGIIITKGQAFGEHFYFILLPVGLAMCLLNFRKQNIVSATSNPR